MNGRLVGITSFMVTEGGGNDGLGFALPKQLGSGIYKTNSETRVDMSQVGLGAGFRTLRQLWHAELRLSQD